MQGAGPQVLPAVLRVSAQGRGRESDHTRSRHRHHALPVVPARLPAPWPASDGEAERGGKGACSDHAGATSLSEPRPEIPVGDKLPYSGGVTGR